MEDLEELKPFYMEERLREDRKGQIMMKRMRERKSGLRVARGLRGICFKLAENALFQSFFNIVIFVNVTLVIVQANLDVYLMANPEDANAQATINDIKVLNQIFTPLFAVEIVVRLWGTAQKHWWNDSWLVMDLTVVVLGIWDDVVLALVLHTNIGGVTALRCTRIVRVFRLGRIIGLLGRFKTLSIVAGVIGGVAARAAWMVLTLCALNWCTAIILTVLTGQSADELNHNVYTMLPQLSDPRGSRGNISESLALGLDEPENTAPWRRRSELFGSMGGSMLLLNIIPLRLIRWGPGLLWHLLMAESPALKVAGVLLLVHTFLNMTCIMSIVSAIFVCALRERANKERQRMRVEIEKEAKITIDDLSEIFETFADQETRTMDQSEFKKAARQFPNIVLFNDPNGSEHELGVRAEACFLELDVCKNHRINLAEFVIGILKLTRVKPRPEFVTHEDQQHRVLIAIKKVTDAYTADYQTTARYFGDFKNIAQLLSESCWKLKKSLESSFDPAELSMQDLSSKDADETQGQKLTRLEKQLESRYGFMTRMKKLQSQLIPLAERQMWVDDKINEHLEPLMESIFYEDVMPWVRDQMPSIKEKWQKTAEQAQQVPQARAKARAGVSLPISTMTVSGSVGLGSALPASSLKAFV